MDRPVMLGFMGGPKVGKTHLALTVFNSKRIDPTRVLYLDNHGSTDAFGTIPGTDMPIPQWSLEHRWGVKHISPDDPLALYNYLLELRKTYFVKKRYPYDAIIVDDWSELAQADIEDRLDDGEKSKTMRHWGEHGDVMRSAARMLHPAITHARSPWHRRHDLNRMCLSVPMGLGKRRSEGRIFQNAVLITYIIPRLPRRAPYPTSLGRSTILTVDGLAVSPQAPRT